MATVSNFAPGVTLALSSADRKAAAAWYEKHLGFKLLYDVEEMGWCEMTTHMDGVTIGFAENWQPKPGNCVPVWEVADIDAARAALEAEGVAFDGPTEVNEGMVKLATFKDRDGNAMMMSQNLRG